MTQFYEDSYFILAYFYSLIRLNRVHYFRRSTVKYAIAPVSMFRRRYVAPALLNFKWRGRMGREIYDFL